MLFMPCQLEPIITSFTKAQMKNGRQCAKITDEDGMKDTGKNKKKHSFHNECIRKEYQN
jgi:hypothetical protein